MTRKSLLSCALAAVALVTVREVEAQCTNNPSPAFSASGSVGTAVSGVASSEVPGYKARAVVGILNTKTCGQGTFFGPSSGVYGEGDDPGSAGVIGYASDPTGYGGYFAAQGNGNGLGSSAALFGDALGAGGTGVLGSTTDGYGLVGVASGQPHGYGVVGMSYATAGVGVRGNALSSTGVTYGLYGYSASQDSRAAGVGGSGITGGVFHGTATGVYATCSGPSCNAAYVEGALTAQGNITVDSSHSYLWGSACVAGACSNSDQRLKKNIEPLAGAMDKLLQIKGVTYEWKTPDDQHPTGKRTGVIAQDVEKVFPEWVSERPDGMKVVNIDQREMLGLTVEALRKVENENNMLRDRVAALESGRQPRISGLNPTGAGLGVGGLAIAGALVVSRRRREEESSK